MGTLTKLDLIDDLTVDFTLSAPYAPFFTNIFLSYGGIVSPTAVEQEGDNFGKKPVGAGPFKFKEWSTGQQIVLERFEEYQNFRGDMDNDGAPYVDAIQFKIISEDATRFAALQSGELHISDVDEKEIPNVQQDDNFQLIVWEDATNMSYFEFANKEPFTNLALRQAIAHAIDRQGIVESAWNGYATPNLLPMPVGDAGWDASIGEEYGYPFDLEAAKQILLDDGFTEGSDGVLEKDGQRLEFSLLMYSGYESARISSEITQANLESIGMKVEIQTMELGAMIAALGEGEFDMNYMNWTWPDPVILSLLFKTPGWTNQMNNPELDALLTTADTTLDPEARIGAIHEALIYILQNAIIAPLATVWSVAAARKAVNGYKWDAVGYPNYVDVWLSDEG